MAQICLKFAHFTSQMFLFYVFNTPCNVSFSYRFTSLKCYKHFLNASNFVFKSPCNVPLSRRFTSQILPKYTRFMVPYARNSRVLLRKCTRFTFSTCPAMYLFRTVLRHKYSLNTPVLCTSLLKLKQCPHSHKRRFCFTYLLTYLPSYVIDMLFTHVHRIGMYVIVYIAELLSLSLSVHEHRLKM